MCVNQKYIFYLKCGGTFSTKITADSDNKIRNPHTHSSTLTPNFYETTHPRSTWGLRHTGSTFKSPTCYNLDSYFYISTSKQDLNGCLKISKRYQMDFRVNIALFSLWVKVLFSSYEIFSFSTS